MQPGVSTSGFGGQMEDGVNPHWRNRSSASGSPADGMAEYDKKKFVGSPTPGKGQEEDMSPLMFRLGRRGVSNSSQVIYTCH